MECPASVDELLQRAHGLAGLRLTEVGERHGLPVPQTLARHKGAVGQLIERALGAPTTFGAGPDFPELGVELKTLPIGKDQRPSESTYVCKVSMDRIADEEWSSSAVREKLRCVLFVPIEGAHIPCVSDRRVGVPVLWRPSPDDESVLRADWESLAGRIGAGEVEDITAHEGTALQLRPKAAHARERASAPGPDGGSIASLPRGFYLRASFTGALIARALGAPALA
ncbi:MAG: DNA mismatch repair endonuclease MutH [Myxococcota bacterium]